MKTVESKFSVGERVLTPHGSGTSRYLQAIEEEVEHWNKNNEELVKLGLKVVDASEVREYYNFMIEYHRIRAESNQIMKEIYESHLEKLN